jgi:hypothetical protein
MVCADGTITEYKGKPQVVIKEPSQLTAANLERLKSDYRVRVSIIKESIRAYSGNCPCPYSIASNGAKCETRSAYSQPGGESPICYLEQVTDQMVQNREI